MGSEWLDRWERDQDAAWVERFGLARCPRCGRAQTDVPPGDRDPYDHRFSQSLCDDCVDCLEAEVTEAGGDRMGDHDWTFSFEVVTRTTTQDVAVNLHVYSVDGDERLCVLNGNVRPERAQRLALDLLTLAFEARGDQVYVDTMLSRGRSWQQIVHDVAALRRKRAELPPPAPGS